VPSSSAEFELCWSKTQHARSIARIRWFGICGMEAEKGTKRVHPTQKPIALFEWCAEKYLPDPGKIWLDPFAGSGISLLGAEKRGQIACCIELSPAYVAVILQRAKDAGMSPRLADV
jgi:site-specific DNA-methyltransferase (adenine-specific)